LLQETDIKTSDNNKKLEDKNFFDCTGKPGYKGDVEGDGLEGT